MSETFYRVTLVGPSAMGIRHAAAYQRLDAFQLVGVCAREHQSSYVSALGASFFKCWRDAIDTTQLNLVCIATHVDSHFEIAFYALEAGAHVFVEKPVARTVEDAIQLFSLARLRERQLIAEYILGHDPFWAEFVDRGKRISGSKSISFHLDQPSSDIE